jgi:hypothetical protein
MRAGWTMGRHIRRDLEHIKFRVKLDTGGLTILGRIRRQEGKRRHEGGAGGDLPATFFPKRNWV